MTAAAPCAREGNAALVRIDWGIRIPMRDGVALAGTLYRPRHRDGALPGVVTITPYMAESAHAAGVFFAAEGFVFLALDCRGRGNSGGEFFPYRNDGGDGADVIEWLARHPSCNGKVAMGGGSYSGFNQWATAKYAPPHLASLMPLCSSFPGLDFPIRNNIGEQYTLQWLAYIAGITLQNNLFFDQAYWSNLWRERFVAGRPYAALANDFDGAKDILRVWMDHPEPDSYWDAFTPCADDYAAMAFPALTLTGYYDDDQHGALAYYRAAERHGAPALRRNNFLVMGPWEHMNVGGVVTSLDGIYFGTESVVDRRALGAEWYRWTLSDGPRPALLKDIVSYYVTGADLWRHAPSLDAVTDRLVPLHLKATDQPRYTAPGALTAAPSERPTINYYDYDPVDIAHADLETEILPYNITDTRLLSANDGKQLVYDSAPFAEETELSGFFRLDAWIGIDQPDTDFRALIYLVEVCGRHILLTNDTKRARYRRGLREACLVNSPEPQFYCFDSFWFTSRMVKSGEFIRLVFGPYNSIYTQKNYNSGQTVSEETIADARKVRVAISIGGEQGAVLYVPHATPASRDDDKSEKFSRATAGASIRAQLTNN